MCSMSKTAVIIIICDVAEMKGILGRHTDRLLILQMKELTQREKAVFLGSLCQS